MIKAKHLSKHFEGLHALKDASLDVEKGEVVCLIGPSGSGKSTFLRCIHGLEIPESGEVYLDGNLLDRTKKDEYRQLRNRMGFVFQHFNLFPNKTVLENCMIAQTSTLKRSPQEAEKIALEYLERVGLLDKKDAYPNKLSGGQKQRVAIVRALCMNPEIMLFDEPTSALDPEMIKEVLEVIQDLAAQGMTMIVVTHEMGFARKVGTKIVFLENGEVIEEASSEDFFSNPKSDRAKDFLSKVFYQ